MRLRYQRRREALLEALAPLAAGSARLGDGAAGLFELVDAARRQSTSRRCSRRPPQRGVGLEGLALHRFAHGGPPGLVLGYGNLSEPAIEQGVRLLGEAYAQVRGGAEGEVERLAAGRPSATYRRTTSTTPSDQQHEPDDARRVDVLLGDPEQPEAVDRRPRSPAGR